MLTSHCIHAIMLNTSSVLHMHPTLVPLVIVQSSYPPFFIPRIFYPLVSPSCFTCCQHVFIMFKSKKEG